MFIRSIAHMNIKSIIKRVPFVEELVKRLHLWVKGNLHSQKFSGSAKYWENRYAMKGNSGVGSYGKFAEFKAEIINKFVEEHEINSIIEYGCGDGNQLKLSRYPSYLGFDVSATVVCKCKEVFKADRNKAFRLMNDYDDEHADLTLSLDVIFHLVEDHIYEAYMRRLFNSSDRYVIIYSSNTDNNVGYEGTHVRHRLFTKWLQDYLSNWKLIEHIKNRYPYQGDYKEGSFADFYIYKKNEQP